MSDFGPGSMYHSEHQNLLRAHKRIEQLERERDALLAALISALGVGYDENGWQDLARAAILARAAREETI
jgi:hypothetical protein